MDKKSYIGLVLIFVILIGFSWFNQPSEAEREQYRRTQDSIMRVEQARLDSLRALQADAAAAASVATADSSALAAKYGLLADATIGTDSLITLENDTMRLVISTKGARIYSAELKGYTAYGDKPLKLFDGPSNEFGFRFIHHNRSFFTNDLYFSTSGIVTEADGSKSLTLSLPIADGQIAFRYTIAASGYEVDFDVLTNNIGDKITINGAATELEWIMDMPVLEKGHKAEDMWSGLYYRYDGGDVEELGSQGEQDETVNMSLDWVAFKDQFFSSVIVADNNFAGAQFESKCYSHTDTLVKHVEAKMGVKFNFFSNETVGFKFLFVPNYFYILESFEGMELTELLPLGWGIFGWINEYFIIPLFKYLETVFDSYGIIILVLTIIIKLLLFPLTYSSYVSQAKMRVLKPQIDEINAKIPADKPMERQQKTMALYRSAGVSPLGGCLPMLIQMPILFAAFRFFPAAFELRGESFLWADDLSTYDSILDLPFSIPFYGDHVSLFCLLMCAVNVVSTMFTMQMQSSNSQMPGMKMMMYLMPVMFLFILNDYPAGLCYYYFVSTLITVLMTTVIRMFFINDAAILAKIEANKKRPQNGKKSGFMARYEEQMRKQMQKNGRR